jgi:hypothetical protein
MEIQCDAQEVWAKRDETLTSVSRYSDLITSGVWQHFQCR